MNAWDIVILQPMINFLIVLSNYCMHNFGITVILLTIIIRAIMLPLTLKQLHSTKALSTLQPKMLELQKKYAKDKQKLAQEQMKLYRESGINPAGCMVPMLIQMPIWFALYQAIILSLAVTPEGLLNLSRYLYNWPMLYPLLPLDSNFLWLDLTKGDMVLAVLVGITMWVQQKQVTATSPDPRTQSQNQMMLYMMPLMFAFFTLSLPSGLSLYWVVSNIFSIVIQYYVTGWGGLTGMFTRRPAAPPEDKFKRRITAESAQRKEEPGPVKRSDTGADISADSSSQTGIGQQGAVARKLRRMLGYPDDNYRSPRDQGKR